jgi:expansin
MRCILWIVLGLGLVACDGESSRQDGPRGMEQGLGDRGPSAERLVGGDGSRRDRPRSDAVMKDKSVVLDGSPFPLVNGKATYYAATGAGACSFPATPNDLMVGAMNDPDYLGSQVCGECVSVTGPKGTILIRIVDLCPECKTGHIDLSQQAFAKIADVALGVVPITWKVVACPVSGPIVYHFKEGSNQWWTAIQLRNTRYAVKTLEAKTGASFVALGRQSYNYFVAASGLGVGPYTLRVTDVLGHTLTDSGIPFKADTDAPGAAQFPP